MEEYELESNSNRYCGGTIFNNAATGVIWIENQISLGGGETILAKEVFRQWLYEKAFVYIKHIHSDNGVFTAEQFKADYAEKN